MKKLICFIVMLLLLLPSVSEAKTYITKTYTTSTKVNSITTFPPRPNVQQTDWGITDTNVQKWWRQGYTGKSVKIAVLDTGVSYYHPDLIGSIAGGVSFVNGENYWTDYEGHGTFVSGEIVAHNNKFGSVGVSYGAKVYAVKVMNRDGEGTVQDLIKGINWCVANHMNIINMSLALSNDEIGTTEFNQLQNAINTAYAKGILIVAASGNDGLNRVSYPANFPNVIAVGGAYEDYNAKTGKTTVSWADYSNYSNKIEVIAPSAFVYSTIPYNITPEWNAYNGYDFMLGTSMASPYVCGFLAILKQKYPTYTNIQLRNLLHTNTLKGSQPRSKIGYGFIYAKS